MNRSRYDDRYYNNHNYNNPYDSRYDPYDNYYLNNARGYSGYSDSMRGNGYDNLNPQYYEMMRRRFYGGKIKSGITNKFW